MKKHNVWKWSATLLIAFSIVLSGCGNNNDQVVPSETPPSENSSNDSNSSGENSSNQDEAVDPGDSEENANNDVEGNPSEDDPAAGQAEGAKGILEHIQNTIDLPAMVELGEAEIADVFYLTSDQYAEGSFKMAMMNIKATDMAVVKLNSADDFETVKEALTKRAEDVIKVFSTYLPDQHEDAKNFQIVQEGDYVLYSISHDQEAVLEAFKDALQ